MSDFKDMGELDYRGLIRADRGLGGPLPRWAHSYCVATPFARNATWTADWRVDTTEFGQFVVKDRDRLLDLLYLCSQG
jgi:hypothetical protein